MASTSFVLVLAAVSSALAASLAPFQERVVKDCGRVWITIHSPTVDLGLDKSLFDAVELNWDYYLCGKQPTKIGLFASKPSDWSDALVHYNITEPKGYEVSNISLAYFSIKDSYRVERFTKGSQCLRPWIAIGNESNIIKENCFKIQPTWMEDNFKKIHGMRIGQMALPGSHNAGSFAFDTEISQQSRDMFILCQDISIWHQLVHGIRYLDFRIAYYPLYPSEEQRYFLNHNFFRVRPLLPLFKEIRKFLDLTKEVVILDVHHLPYGFYNTTNQPLASIHNGLLDIIQKEFGDFIAPFSFFGNLDPLNGGAKLSDFLHSDKRLIVSYCDNTISAQNDWLWPNLPHLWANTNNVYTLLDYLDTTIPNHPTWNARTPLHSAMAQVTLTPMDMILFGSTLRGSADLVNRNITDRLLQNPLWRSSVNILSTDFVLGNDVVDAAIELNIQRAH